MDNKKTQEVEIAYIENVDYRFETEFYKRNEVDVIDGIKIINPLHKYRLPRI